MTRKAQFGEEKDRYKDSFPKYQICPEIFLIYYEVQNLYITKYTGCIVLRRSYLSNSWS